MTTPEQIDAAVVALTSRLEHLGQMMPPHTAPPHVHWQRSGLIQVHQRLEDLKQTHAYLAQLDEEAQLILGSTRSMLAEVKGYHDDVVGAGLEATVSTMAARGMAADERRIGHDTRAMAWTIRLRRLERLLPLAETTARTLATRLYGVRDERQDLRTQIKAIDVGVEIGEL